MGLLGKKRVSQGGRSTLILVRQDIVQELCNYGEAVKQQIICGKWIKTLMVVGTLCVKYALVRGSKGIPPGKMLEFGFSESASSGYPHLS